jgi:hypothetical protein
VLLKLLLEDEIEDKLARLIKLQAYVGEYNVPCDVELVDDDLVALMHSGARYVVDDKMLGALQSAKGVYWYALNIKGRFELGEPVIAKDGNVACSYARRIIKSRWPSAEAVLATKQQWAYEYAKTVLHGPFPAGESVILAGPDTYMAGAYKHLYLTKRKA